MGYTTTFKGELKFEKEPTASVLAKLKNYLGEDCREHPEWNAKHLYYIALELSPDFSGLVWDGSEKVYDMPDLIDVLIREMRKSYPEFNLVGKMAAQGEDPEDRWWLIMRNGKAVKEEIPLALTEIICPHCGELIDLTQIKK